MQQVKVDPKVLAARRNDGQKIVQNVSISERSKEQAAQQWRRTQGLAPMKRERGFTLVELLILIFSLVAVSCVAGVIYIGFHFLAKIW